MRARTARFLAVAQALLLVGTLVLPALTYATVSTDKVDYAPGSVVTISGDNTNDAGYASGETVHVDVTGPNGWSASCEGAADELGAWSCQVTLNADPDVAVGDYSYVATGLMSGVSETGVFSDGANITITNQAFAWHRTGEVAGGFDVAIGGKYTCNSASTNCTSIVGINVTVTGAAGSKLVAGLSTGQTNTDWGTTLEFRVSPGPHQFAIPADGKFDVNAVLDTNLADQPASRAAYFGIDNTPPSSAITCNSAACVGPYAADVTIRLAGSDPNGSNGSGFASGLYCTDTTNTCTPTTAYPNSSGVNLPRVSGATYYVRYAGTDTAGNFESVKSAIVPFTTDDPAPFVSSTSPSNGATAAANANIVVSFSEAVTVTTSPTWITVTCNGSPVSGTTTGSGTSVVTFNPTTDIASGASCSVQIQKNQVTDGGGNNMAANGSFTFSVDAAPSVTSSTPSNGATGVGLTGASITFNFSEAVNVDFITVACSTSLTHTFSRTGNGTSAVSFTLAASESYAAGETCLVTLNTNTVHDVDPIDPPDGLAANYAFSFTTVVTTSPSVTTIACPASEIYTGSAIEPCTYIVTGAGGLNIGPNPVPSSGYSSNVNVGTATAAYTYPGDATHTSSSDSKTFGITKASTTTTVSCPAGPYAYTGAAQEPCSYSVTGANLALGPLAVPTDGYSDNTNAGTATAAYTYLGDTNHTGSNNTDTFAIGKADVYCTVTGYDVTYNAAAHTATGSCIGVLGETVSGLDLSPTTHTHAGDYTDSWTFTDTTGNYADTGDTVSDVIHKADSTTTVVCPAGPYVYTGSSQEPCTASWSSNGTDLEGGALTPTYADNVHAGTATASAEFLGDADHNGSNDDETFTIGQRSITVTATNQTKVLGATLTFAGTEFSITSGTMVVGESIASVTLTSAGAPAAAGVGPYPINPSAAVFSNALASDYLVSYAPGTLAVQYASTGTCLGAAGHSILQPINIDGTSVSKQGSTVPAKFRVCDAFGQSIGTPGVVTNFVLYQKIGATNETVNELVDSTTPDTAFRWSATDQQWVFNINTKPLQKNYKYFYRVDLNDGSSIYFAFSLK